MLATYNLEDCHALRRVVEFIYATIARATQGTEAQAAMPAGLTATRIEDVEKLTDYEKWGDVDFFFPDFRHVNNCSHFDYQRERVYARTRKLAKRKKKGRQKRWSLTLRITRHVRITVSKRPSCGSTMLSEVHHRDAATCPLPTSKRALDLEITSIGIKRKVIEFRTAAYCCGKCGETFVSQPYQRIDKYFHKLKAWAIYQHIGYRLSFKAIQKMFEELFSLRLCYSDVYMFKSVMADYYRSTYWKLLKRLLSGQLLHIDETDIKLQGGKKVYVWVFSNLEEVVFMYKPTREGEFLQKLLKNFRGVLVSDFYSVYDGINCPQQKCLIHLMRDMNHELLSNPFDLELQAVTRPFGVLLREIVATIDRHGLKKKALSKHAKSVESFLRTLSEQSFRSEAATSIQHRLLKYRNKLFTFMEYDDVPWNNNNAEHAIKDFAHYRELNTGNMSVPGLTDYLILLSIGVTCRYKDIRFFRFLLSGQKDVQAFAANKKQKRLPAIETYSKGNIPPYILHRQRKKVTRKRSGSENVNAGEHQTPPDQIIGIDSAE